MPDPTLLLANDFETFLFAGLGALLFMIPIAAILTHHQRKMAEIVRKERGGDVAPALLEEIKQLRSEVLSMRTELNANTIAIDNVSSNPLSSSSDTQRLEKRVQAE